MTLGEALWMLMTLEERAAEVERQIRKGYLTEADADEWYAAELERTKDNSPA